MLFRHGSNAMIQSKLDLRPHRGRARLARVAGFKRTSGMLMPGPNISNTVLKTDGRFAVLEYEEKLRSHRCGID